MMNKSHIQNTVPKAINIYIYILIHSAKNVELQMYAKIVFFKICFKHMFKLSLTRLAQDWQEWRKFAAALHIIVCKG